MGRGSNIEIRNCREDDIEALIELWKELMIDQGWRGDVDDPERQKPYRDSYLRSIRKEPEGFFIAILNGEAVGFARAYTKTEIQRIRSRRKIGEVSPCVVKREFRRKGIGTRLMERCFEYLKREGCGSVILHVTHDNTPAIKFYEKLGFKPLQVQMVKWKL